MTDSPKRRWFQIHLSTAIVLMFVAGGLLWMNLMPAQFILIENSFGIKSPMNIKDAINDKTFREIEMDRVYTCINEYGWPQTYIKCSVLAKVSKGREIPIDLIEWLT